MYVRIFLNVHKDEDGRHPGFAGYQPGHRLNLVFAYFSEQESSQDDEQPQAVLNEAFHELNVGAGAIAEQYRARRLRSLSVGDVVVVEDDAYSVASFGFEREHRPLLVVNDPEAYGATPLSQA